MNKNTSKAFCLSAIAALIMLGEGVAHADWTPGASTEASATVPSVTATVPANDPRYHPTDEPPANVGDKQTLSKTYTWTPQAGEPTVPPSSRRITYLMNLTHSLTTSVTPTYVGHGTLEALAELTLGIYDPAIPTSSPIITEVYQAKSYNDSQTGQVVTNKDPTPNFYSYSQVFQTEQAYDVNRNPVYSITGRFQFSLANRAYVRAETLWGDPQRGFIQSGSGTATSGNSSTKTSGYLIGSP